MSVTQRLTTVTPRSPIVTSKHFNSIHMKDVLSTHNSLKEKHPDAIFLYRIEDFYICINDDAQTATEILHLGRTKQAKKIGVKYCQFPKQALDIYLPRLIRSGQRVAICELQKEQFITK